MFGGINFDNLIKKIHQFAKLKSRQKFPAIRYILCTVAQHGHLTTNILVPRVSIPVPL